MISLLKRFFVVVVVWFGIVCFCFLHFFFLEVMKTNKSTSSKSSFVEEGK